jgi:hypothetical protein
MEAEDLTGRCVRMNCRRCAKTVLAILERTSSPCVAPTDMGSNAFAEHFAHCRECRHTAFDYWNWKPAEDATTSRPHSIAAAP